MKSDEVLLYGDRIRVDNNGQTAAMFIGGKINADFIDADKSRLSICGRNLRTGLQRLVISETMRLTRAK